ncbi:glycosyltransferase family 4 protein [Dyella acidiphila]|uniref:Glycosyltransferase family 4 protein n=1 Tax=Dyella acidiphila TaxID=2775866 RepID=A0ABR9G592_9GAMM|nr:glycosyltransferase family 1 protein [Dyella acidiphila]MBE1159199.1 glycosyltransferase family 4 protein [Dyella acidiphila]
MASSLRHSRIRLAVSRLLAMTKETLRTASVSVGRYALQQPAVRGVTGRLLDLHPGLKRRMIALVSGVSLSEVTPTATMIHLASLRSSDGLSRTASEAFRLLKQRAGTGGEVAQAPPYTVNALAAESMSAATPRLRLALITSLAAADAQAATGMELLSLLADSYDVDLISDDSEPVGNLAVRRLDIESFRACAADYDRVVYHVADATLYLRMLALLEEIPGLVVLERCHWGDVLRQLESSGEHPRIWWRALYESHGYPALIERQRAENERDVAAKYPCSWRILADAEGVVVHAHADKDLIADWYGPQLASRVQVVALQRQESRGTEVLHDTKQVALAYAQAIESLVRSSPRRQLAAQVLGANSVPPDEAHWLQTARALAEKYPLGGEQTQLLVDVSTLSGTDAKSGVQRVVRNVLAQLLDAAPDVLRVEPVYADPAGNGYRYARQFATEFLGFEQAPGVDAEVDMSAGDIFLGLDLCAHIVPARLDYFRALRERGVSIQFVLYDLLPALYPDWFPPGLAPDMQRWYRAIAEVSDRIIAISRAVAVEYRDWLEATRPARAGSLQIGYFHLGADLDAGMAMGGTDAAVARSLAAIAGRPLVLMVGTVEPRKGHEVALRAFEQLWSNGSEAVLVVVGKRGWRVDALAGRLAGHAEQGRRLYWFQGISDAGLELVYRDAALLLATSFGEGFGLPLIEAAHRGVPLLVRDIPVFREVAGDGALYFQDDSPAALADSIAVALAARERGELPSPGRVLTLTWAQSAQALGEALAGRHDLHSWNMPG